MARETLIFLVLGPPFFVPLAIEKRMRRGFGQTMEAGGLITVSTRRIRPNLSYILIQFCFIRCFTRAPG